MDRTVLESALDSNFNDFEDAVIYYSGNDSGVNGIVTRNTGDFKPAQLPIYQPDDLWALIKTSTSFRFQDQWPCAASLPVPSAWIPSYFRSSIFELVGEEIAQPMTGLLS